MAENFVIIYAQLTSWKPLIIMLFSIKVMKRCIPKVLIKLLKFWHMTVVALVLRGMYLLFLSTPSQGFVLYAVLIAE